jgi:endonuclease/exonuclease/phosphatase family metal-dependent hydrolase
VTKKAQTAEELAQQALDDFVTKMTVPDFDGTLKVVSLNVQRDHPMTAPLTDIDKVLSKADADIMGLQEAKDYDSILSSHYGPDWYYLRDSADSTKTQQVPLMVRKARFDVVNPAPDGFFCAAAGGDFWNPERWGMRARLRHKATGQIITVLNTHTNPGPFRGGAKGRNLYTDHMDSVCAQLDTIAATDLSFITGDFNTNYKSQEHRSDHMSCIRRFGALGYTCSFAHGPMRTWHTHGANELYDYVFAHRDAQVVFKNDQVVTTPISDHNAVVAYYKIAQATA